MARITDPPLAVVAPTHVRTVADTMTPLDETLQRQARAIERANAATKVRETLKHCSHVGNEWAHKHACEQCETTVSEEYDVHVKRTSLVAIVAYCRSLTANVQPMPGDTPNRELVKPRNVTRVVATSPARYGNRTGNGQRKHKRQTPSLDYGTHAYAIDSGVTRRMSEQYKRAGGRVDTRTLLALLTLYRHRRATRV